MTDDELKASQDRINQAHALLQKIKALKRAVVLFGTPASFTPDQNIFIEQLREFCDWKYLSRNECLDLIRSSLESLIPLIEQQLLEL